MNENGKNDERQISSVDILRKSGLSRATLNNYIKMGILPHPIVKKPDDHTVSKAKQMGYFPYSVLDTLDRIIQYKKAGCLMKEICTLLTQRSIGSSEGIPEDIVPAKDTGGMFSRKRLSDYRNGNEELFPLMETGHGTLSTDAVTKRDTRVLFRQGRPMLLSISILAAELQNLRGTAPGRIFQPYQTHMEIDLAFI
jgi:DNA-binding transcriptional MerR regulator